ncbi:MAG: zinc ABC transporter permease AztB [Microthrixaceae bacterium]|nr:zinc ABC transporter permease AztB [Microthrixaceae bacterium]
MRWLTEAFEPAFMQRALLAGLMTAAVTSVVGTWVVIRGLAFMGDALAHGVIPGIAVAVIWGFNPLLGAMVAALVMGGAVSLVSSRTNLREDTSIGLLFVGMLALGIVIISRSDSFATDVTSLLFGDVLGVTTDDLLGQLALSTVAVAVVLVLYRPLLALSFNRDKAATLRLAPGWTHFALMAVIALSIVSSFQSIGTLLVFGLLIGPPATAFLIVRRVPAAMAVAVLIGAACVVGGLVISFHFGTAGGATIAGLCVLVFFAALLLGELRVALHRFRGPINPTAPEAG